MSTSNMTATRGYADGAVAAAEGRLNASLALLSATVAALSGSALKSGDSPSFGAVTAASLTLGGQDLGARLSAVEAAVAGKQAALTAGTGITIADGVISASADLSSVDARVAAVEAAVAQRQAALTAGTGITIANGVISATQPDLTAYATSAALSAAVLALETAIGAKQPALTAGTGIVISNGVISSTAASDVTRAYVDQRANALQAAIDGKQGALQAGAGISIFNGVISATGTAPDVDKDYVDQQVADLQLSLSSKQGALTAGAGITIANGVISATGTADLSSYATATALASAKTQLENLIAQKQGALTAGTGITIANGVISAQVADLSSYATAAALADVAGDVAALGTSKQDALTAGTGVAIANGVISCSLDLSPYALSATLASAVATINEALAGKQGTLTAGTGITISGGVISASAAPDVTKSYVDEKLAVLEGKIGLKAADFSIGSGLTLLNGTLSANAPDLSAYSTTAAMNSAIAAAVADLADTYQAKLEAGTGISIAEGKVSLSADALSGLATDEDLADLKELLLAKDALKQDKLTAGTGITITGSTISSAVPDLSSYATTAALSSAVTSLTSEVAKRQKTLTAGTGLTITGTTISLSTPMSSYATATALSTARSELEVMINNKQNTLVSGTGISIVGNVISCTVTADSYVSASGQNPVTGKAVYDFATGAFVSSTSLTTTLASYATQTYVTALLAGYATQTSLNTTLASYVQTSVMNAALAAYVQTSSLRSTVDTYGYASASALATMETTLKAYADAKASSAMTYKGTVAAVANLPGSALRSVGDLYYVTGATAFYICNGAATDANAWDVVNLGVDVSSFVQTSTLTAHVGNQNAEKHVTAADISNWNAKADATALTTHTQSTSHLTAAERTAWNAKADSSALTAHTESAGIHVTAEEKAAWNAAAAASGAATVDAELSTTSTNVVQNKGVAKRLVKKQDGIGIVTDISKPVKFRNALALPLIDENNVLVGMVTRVEAGGSSQIGATAPNYALPSRIDVVLFRRGILDGLASDRCGSEPIFDSPTAKKYNLSGECGYEPCVVGGATDPNSVSLSFRQGSVGYDSSRFSPNYYPVNVTTGGETSGKPWDAVNCSLTTGVITLMVGGASVAHPYQEAHVLRWAGSVSGSDKTFQVFVGGARILGFEDVETGAITSGHAFSLVTSDLLHRELQSFQPSGGSSGGSGTVDDALSDTSENAVQNKVVKAAIDAKLDALTYDYVDTRFTRSGSVDYSDSFGTGTGQTAYVAGDPYVVDTLGAPLVDGGSNDAASVTGQFAAKFNFTRGTEGSDEITACSLQVTNGAALAALSPNGSANAADFVMTATFPGPVDIGTIYAVDSTIRQDKVRRLAAIEYGLPVGTIVWESCPTNGSAPTAFAYLAVSDFPVEDVKVSGQVDNHIINAAPEEIAEGSVVSAAGVARALAEKMDKGTLASWSDGTATGAVQIKFVGAYTQMYDYDWGAFPGRFVPCYDDTGKRLITSASNASFSRADGVSQLGFTYASHNVAQEYIGDSDFIVRGGAVGFTSDNTDDMVAQGQSTYQDYFYSIGDSITSFANGNIKTESIQTTFEGVTYGVTLNVPNSFSMNAATAQTVTNAHVAAVATGESELYPMGDTALYAGPKPEGQLLYYGTRYGWRKHGQTSYMHGSVNVSRASVFFSRKSKCLYVVASRIRMTAQSARYSPLLNVVLKFDVVTDALEQQLSVEVTSTDITPTLGHTEALITSDGVAKAIMSRLRSGTVYLGGGGTAEPYEGGTSGDLFFNGFKMCDQNGYIPTNRLNLGYLTGDLQTAAYSAGGSINSVVRFGNKYYATAGTVGTGCVTDAALYSSTDGLTWTAVSGVSALTKATGVSAGDGFVAVSGADSDGAALYLSTDGTTWTKAVFNQCSAPAIGKVVKGGSTYVALGALETNSPFGYESKYLYASSDGVNWTQAQTVSGGNTYILDVLYTGSSWVVSDYGVNDWSIRYASNPTRTWTRAAHWSNGRTPALSSISGIAYNNGVLMVCWKGTWGDKIWRSPNLTSWTQSTVSSACPTSYTGITYKEGTWIAFGETGMAQSSDDGMSWTPIVIDGAVGIARDVRSLGIGSNRCVNGAGILYVITGNASYPILYSADGKTWGIVNTGKVYNCICPQQTTVYASGSNASSTTYGFLAYTGTEGTRGGVARVTIEDVALRDSLPTSNSKRAVTSGGIKTYVDSQVASVRSLVNEVLDNIINEGIDAT